MKTILIMNQKGGVGKTLIADELAFALERDHIPYNFYDMDGQGSPIHKPTKTENAEIQIIDTAGALNSHMGEWIENADFVIIPTMMSHSDVPPLERMIDICSRFENKKPILYVFNRFNRFSISRDFISWFNIRFPELKTITLAETVAFAQAGALGKSIVEYQPNNKGSKDIEKIYSIIKFQLNLKERETA
jgi:chromosome partitioning protein